MDGWTWAALKNSSGGSYCREKKRDSLTSGKWKGYRGSETASVERAHLTGALPDHVSLVPLSSTMPSSSFLLLLSFGSPFLFRSTKSKLQLATLLRCQTLPTT